MNIENLHEVINRYEAHYYDVVNSKENDEIFKWKAVQQFHSVWFSESAASMKFSEMFSEAKKECSNLLDNSHVLPTNGIVKMAEACPDEVETLFREVLFADYESINEVQDHMDAFLEGIEKVRQKTLPQCWKYKQERHAASCYLAFFAPEKHFIYRYSEAEDFAKCIEFGKDIGSGESFSLANYYEMAEIVVDALKQHPKLIDMYQKLIRGNLEYYQDESLHLMAFDLMYCCRTYNFYAGLTHALKKDSIKAYKLEQLRQEEQNKKEAAIASLQDEIHHLEMQMQPIEEISLIGVEVIQEQYGKGIVVKQDGIYVTIHFDEMEKAFELGNNFLYSPRFENDQEILDMFTQYKLLFSKYKQKCGELIKLQSTT